MASGPVKKIHGFGDSLISPPNDGIGITRIYRGVLPALPFGQIQCITSLGPG
jgi:hypothetical protein